jgi:hypothetical protein
VTPELRERARQALNTMCCLDGISFDALCDDLDWAENEV